MDAIRHHGHLSQENYSCRLYVGLFGGCNREFLMCVLKFQFEGKVFFEEPIQSSPFISIHHEEFHSESVSLCPGDSRQTY